MKKLMEKLEQVLARGGVKKDIILLAVSGIALIVSIFNLLSLPFDVAWIAIILCGVPIVLEAIIGLVTAFDIKADVLVSIALIASVIIGEDFAAGEIAFIMQLGALLEDLTVAKARAGIERLVHLTPQTARVISAGGEIIIPCEQVKIGDILRVLPGESVPVDGVILSGQTSINQAVMTGEPLLVDKGAGDEVLSGTVNQFGSFEMRAVKVGQDSSIQRMISLVQSADPGKAKIVGIADRWAAWIVAIALAAAALTWIITGEIIRAVTILVVFCPCALVLATPTAIMAAIGNAAKHGLLVKEGGALEKLARVSRIAFDKTGTLTYGVPEVKAIFSMDAQYSEDELYMLAASAEIRSEHPLGKAVVRCYKRDTASLPFQPEAFQMLPGRGVWAVSRGLEVLAGNQELLRDRGIIIPEEWNCRLEAFLSAGCTIIFIALNKVPAGFIALADELRPQSAQIIKRLLTLKVAPVLLTGDHPQAAQSIARQLGINEVHAQCMPEDKLKYIDGFQKLNQPVCMIGDGINDAPALKKADVGIAMGGVGSDIAVDAADIALVDDEIKELPHLFALARRMLVTIKCNLSFSMLLNFIAIALAITGVLNPVVGALVHNAGSVLVIINSALLLRWKRRRWKEAG